MAYIGLDIGHGSNTFPPNKGVYRNGKGYAEYDFNRKLGKRVKELLEQNEHKVILGQPLNGKDVPLITRTNLYNREKVDLVLSLHANAGASNVSGRCAFYWGTSSKSKTLAQAVINEIKAKGYSTHGNGLHAGVRGTWTNLHINRETNMPAVLVEHGFMTNASDFQLIFGNKQNEYIEDMAQADVAGVVKWLGGKPVKPSKPSKPSKPAEPSTGSDGLYGARLVKKENAYFLATEDIKVRNAPSTSAKHTGTLPKGSSINYFKVYEGNGYRWLQYTGNSGNTLYVPYRESGSGKEQWGTFHDTRPNGSGNTSKSKKKSISQMADEVEAGKHGSGHTNRRKSLGISQSEYEKVRAEVNRRAGQPRKPARSIDSMANDIINNPKAPNGHSARQKWLGVDNATYQKVRARVNQKLS